MAKKFCGYYFNEGGEPVFTVSGTSDAPGIELTRGDAQNLIDNMRTCLVRADEERAAEAELLRKVAAPKIGVRYLKGVEVDKLKEHCVPEAALRSADALLMAFTWSTAPEGGDYWSQVYDRLCYIAYALGDASEEAGN